MDWTDYLPKSGSKIDSPTLPDPTLSLDSSVELGGLLAGSLAGTVAGILNVGKDLGGGVIRIDGVNRKISLLNANVPTIVIDATTQQITIGGTNVTIDGVNKRIIVNDGTNDRVVMGYLAGGF